MLDFNLSPEQIQLRQKAREFALKEILPAAWYYDEKNEVPVDILVKAFQEGLMSNEIPREYGGRGLGIIESVLVTEELSAACTGIATSISDNSLGYTPIILSDREAIKKKYLTMLAREPKFICYATSEPTMGSDVASLRCLAEKKGNDYILNGTKYWITNAGIADYMTIFATIDPKSQHEGICAFVVERGWEGVTVGPHIPKLGQRASNTAGINFKNVLVPAENVLAEPGKGFLLAMRTFSLTRPGIGAFAVGAARSAMEFAVDYMKKRQAFGMKLKNFEALQFKVAEMFQKVETARLLVWKAAWDADSGKDATIDASIAKMYATEAAFEVAGEALQIAGGYGYSKLYPFEKILRDLRLPMIYEGTSEIQRYILSGFVLNMYRPVMPPIEDIPQLRGDPGSADFEAVKGNRTAWRCRICGHIHYGETPPEECPSCFFPAAAFKKVWPV